MKIRALIIFILIVNFSFSQKNNKLFIGNVVSDSTTVLDNRLWKNHFDSILNSKNEIEIRVFIQKSNEFILFTFNNETWYLEKLFPNKMNQNFDSKKITNQYKLKKLFKNLVDKDIFVLPNSNKRNAEKFYYDYEQKEITGLGISISHPLCDYIEFKVGGMMRSYSFCEVKEFNKFYPNDYNYMQFEKIITALERIN